MSPVKTRTRSRPVQVGVRKIQRKKRKIKTRQTGVRSGARICRLLLFRGFADLRSALHYLYGAIAVDQYHVYAR